MTRGPRWVASFALLSLACVGEQYEIPLEAGDDTAFAADVQPVIGLSCGSLDCHGDRSRPLRIYAAHGLRLRADLRGLPVDSQEAAHNAAALRGISPDPDPIDDHLALVNPLGVTAGGTEHFGYDVWPTRAEPGYTCLRAWLNGTIDTADAAMACAEALDRISAPPP